MKPKLLSKDFLLLWQGQTISMLGTQAFLIGVVFWIKHATSSATLIGLLGLATGIPLVLFGVIGGTFADRFSRRNIIIFCDVVDGIAVLGLAALMYFQPASTDLLLVGIFVAAAIMGLMAPFFAPAITAAIPDLVTEEKTAPANSMMHISMETAGLLGQAVGGVLFRILGAPVLLLVDGISYLLAAGSECFMRIPQRIPDKQGDWRRQLRDFKNDTVEGCRYIYRRSGLVMLVVASSLMSFFSVPIIILLPFYVEDFLKLRPDWYGFILAAYGAGTVCGYVLAGALKPVGRTRARYMITAMMFQALMAIGLALTTNQYAALALAAVAGLFGGFIIVSVTTLVQITTPDEMRGRVFGLLATIGASISPIAMALAGVVADMLHKNVPLIYLGCGACMACVASLVPLSAEYRKFLGSLPPEKAAAVAAGKEVAHSAV